MSDAKSDPADRLDRPQGHPTIQIDQRGADVRTAAPALPSAAELLARFGMPSERALAEAAGAELVDAADCAPMPGGGPPMTGRAFRMRVGQDWGAALARDLAEREAALTRGLPRPQIAEPQQTRPALAEQPEDQAGERFALLEVK